MQRKCSLLFPKKQSCPLKCLPRLIWGESEAEVRDSDGQLVQTLGWGRDWNRGQGGLWGCLVWGSSINTDLLILVVISRENVHTALNPSSPFKGAHREHIEKAFDLVSSSLIYHNEAKTCKQKFHSGYKNMLLGKMSNYTNDNVINCCHIEVQKQRQLAIWTLWPARTHLWKLFETQAITDGWWKVGASSSFVDARYWTWVPGALTVCWGSLGSISQRESSGLVCA